jgi:hypothetical protein
MPFFKTYFYLLKTKTISFFKHDLVKKHLQKLRNGSTTQIWEYIYTSGMLHWKVPIMSYTREVLSKRHRLSHQQIDHWLGKIAASFLQEKLNHLKMLRNFIAITDLLRQNEIPFISLKGPLLSQHIYNDPTVWFSMILIF